VSGDLAIIAFDDILLSESVNPTLTLHPRLIERNAVMAVPASSALSVAGLPVPD